MRFRYCRPAAVGAWGEMARPAPSLAGYPGPVTLVAAAQCRLRHAPRCAPACGATWATGLTETAIDAGHMLFWDAPAEVGALIARGALGLMPGARSTRRLAWASYGTAIGLALGTVAGLAMGSEIAAAVGAAVGAIGGVVLGRLRERRA